VLQWFFLQFKQRISKGFPSLFPEVDSEGIEKDYSSEGQFAAKWGWFGSIHTLAGGSITRFNEVTSQKLIDSLTWLEYEKDKGNIERRKYK